MPELPQDHSRQPTFWTILAVYALFNAGSIWVVVVLACFASYPLFVDRSDKAARIGEHLQKLFTVGENVIVFAVYSVLSVGIHILFWWALLRYAPVKFSFTIRHVAYAVATHFGLFIGGNALALLVV